MGQARPDRRYRARRVGYGLGHEAQGRAVPAGRDGGGQPRRHHRHVAGHVSPGLAALCRGNPQDRGEPQRPLRRLPGHAERPARAHHVAHGKGAAGDRAGAGSDGPGARRSLECRADGAGAAARRAAHLFHQSLARRLPDQPARRHEPRLPQGAIHRVPRFGVRGQPGDERRHRHQPGHGNAQDLQLLRAQGERLHHRDLDRRPRQPRRDRLRLDGEILLRRIADRPDTFESVGQGARHLFDQPGRHLVADPSRPEARSGPGRAHHQEPSRGDQQRRWPLSHHLQRRADRVGDPARPSGDRQARDPQDHLRRRAGARRPSSRSS